MPAASLTLEIDQGATLETFFDVKDGAGQPVPLTGYAVHGQIRASAYDPGVLLDLTLDSGRLALDAQYMNRLWLRFPPADTLALPAGTLVYDVFWTRPDGRADRILAGDALVTRAVTR